MDGTWDGTWDVLEDLRFLLLIATDDQLQDGLAHVCSMLDDDSDDSRDASIEGRDLETIVVANTESDIKQTKAKPSRKQKKPRTTFEVRQREELQRLRAEVDTLKDNLRSLETASHSCEGKMSFWKRLAHDEKLEKNKALHENEALREAVDQQATFIDQMKKVFLKKPRLTHHHDVHSAEWQIYRLTATIALRRAAIHAIADRQFSRMSHAYLRAGLLERTDDFTKAELKFEVMGGSQANYLLLGVTETFELIDESTVYSRIADPNDPAMTWHSNLIRKLYREPGRNIFIVRTVLDDALVPQMSVGGVENKSAWGQVLPLDDTSCRITLLIEIGLNEILNDPAAVRCAVEMANRMKRTFPSGLAVKQGEFSIVPALFDVDLIQVEHPSIRFFLENGKRIRDAINLALYNVIQRIPE
ncbi:hypothetical protein AeMF1_002831 [Aphanomyces euteiches]|nr:hypothetical protein AeMF1_002831 [Aphanomyces euteiches]KAH9182130.1 hypothetical protein AeNC1_015893 [Aphanomyces euteiches]